MCNSNFKIVQINMKHLLYAHVYHMTLNLDIFTIKNTTLKKLLCQMINNI